MKWSFSCPDTSSLSTYLLTFACTLPHRSDHCDRCNGANVLFPLNTPLLPSATSVFGSYIPVISLPLANTIYCRCGLAYPCDWSGQEKKYESGFLSLLSGLLAFIIPLSWFIPFAFFSFFFLLFFIISAYSYLACCSDNHQALLSHFFFIY
jgi:hypothetical protein